MNQFIIRGFAIIFSLLLFSYLIEALYNVDFVPAINVFIKNYLYIVGIMFSFLLYFLLKRIFIKSLSLKIIMIVGLIICNVRFYFLASLFNKEYNEKIAIPLNEEAGIYVSKVVSSSSLFGMQNYYRVYKSNFPFSKTIEMIYASEVKLINIDTTAYSLQCFKKRGIDTVYVSTPNKASK
jgi:hypothetical protein